MNASLVIEDAVALLQRRYGKSAQIGRSRVYRFGSAMVCSINYSKLLGGHRYFFGLSQEILNSYHSFPKTASGNFVVLVCAAPDNLLVLPHQLVLDWMQGVVTRRIDILVEDGSYILQTTKHPKLNVTEFLNRLPKPGGDAASEMLADDDALSAPSSDRVHVKMQWALIQLGRAEGCTVWVPPNDRNLAYQRQSFVPATLAKLPNFGFDENTRRIVQNIDVLWLRKNVISKAFEVESTTSIYSGLLRLNDLVLAQPNNRIDLYIAASRARREKVRNQMLRPSFQTLLDRCYFLSFDAVEEQLKRLESLSLAGGTQVSGLIQGEQFTMPEHYVYPSYS